MIKSFLITTSGPLCGTEQYYAAYAEDENTLLDWLYSNWFDEECQDLFDQYSYLIEDELENEWEESSDEYESREEFDDIKFEDWCTNCGLEVSEISEEEFGDYGDPEVIYDERQ